MLIPSMPTISKINNNPSRISAVNGCRAALHLEFLSFAFALYLNCFYDGFFFSINMTSMENGDRQKKPHLFLEANNKVWRQYSRLFFFLLLNIILAVALWHQCGRKPLVSHRDIENTTPANISAPASLSTSAIFQYKHMVICGDVYAQVQWRSSTVLFRFNDHFEISWTHTANM